MAASGRSAVRRAGRILTGFGALVVLVGLLAGGPIALLAFAGNPLPDHLPTLAEVGTALTSRDDGQLFLRALALVGWFGWATFAFSVLVELGAQALRRPAPKLPGMSRQQRAAAALVGSVALILAASPAATAAPRRTPPGATPGHRDTAPAWSPRRGRSVHGRTGDGGRTRRPPARAAPGRGAGIRRAVYRVAKGDYLGEVAERYLDDFERLPELAALNRLADPDRIRPGQLIKLPGEAADEGARPHATGRLVTRAATPPSPGPAAPERAERKQPRRTWHNRTGTQGPWHPRTRRRPTTERNRNLTPCTRPPGGIQTRAKPAPSLPWHPGRGPRTMRRSATTCPAATHRW